MMKKIICFFNLCFNVKLINNILCYVLLFIYIFDRFLLDLKYWLGKFRLSKKEY